MMLTAEKGMAWRRLTIGGTPSHGSAPFATDNALVKAAEIIGGSPRMVAPRRAT